MNPNLRIKSKIDFNTSFKNIGIIYFKSNGANYYKITLSELLSISNKYHWIHDLDVDDNEEIISTKIVKPVIISKSTKMIDDNLIDDDCIIQPPKIKKIIKKVVKKVEEPSIINDEECNDLYELF